MKAQAQREFIPDGKDLRAAKAKDKGLQRVNLYGDVNIVYLRTSFPNDFGIILRSFPFCSTVQKKGTSNENEPTS
jgi:hypothetical protein